MDTFAPGFIGSQSKSTQLYWLEYYTTVLDGKLRMWISLGAVSIPMLLGKKGD